ncbi:hypothetical protein A8E36_01035 [Burkholderia cenocepacia]|nr:hypothetical protein A8D61_09710 [Burkholderia cenocepacia]AQQ22994.1 hypothetical protein A8D61_11700 [Burkholderia cenocepacia]AQQ23010.1 hypothetical protein A8D61_12750 [Burkholderia cenocepacia]ONJ20754.1 hypothetical protein A8D82_04925 [Burkholderia cenocepacia]ONJ20762.1 hypothetical protein A8D82_05980 [Burkholderia cenocepacia]
MHERSGSDGKQVRPWLAKPASPQALRVRLPDCGANQHIPSGTVAEGHNQSPNVRVQSLPRVVTY